MKKTIGFIVLSWNSEKYIKQCLDAIFCLKDYISHVVVIDNGSADLSTRIIDSVDTLGNMLHIICHDTNLGTTKTRNEGIRYLKQYNPDYYCFLDSDAVINQDAITKLIDTLDSDKSYGLAGPSMILENGELQLSARRFPTLIDKSLKVFPLKSLERLAEYVEGQGCTFDLKGRCLVDYMLSACWLVRPEVFDKAGLFDENIFYAPEDAEFCIRVWKAGYKVVYQKEAVVLHYWQRLSKKKVISKMNLEHIKGLLYMFSKHHYCFSGKSLRNQ